MTRPDEEPHHVRLVGLDLADTLFAHEDRHRLPAVIDVVGLGAEAQEAAGFVAAQVDARAVVAAARNRRDLQVVLQAADRQRPERLPRGVDDRRGDLCVVDLHVFERGPRDPVVEDPLLDQEGAELLSYVADVRRNENACAGAVDNRSPSAWAIAIAPSSSVTVKPPTAPSPPEAPPQAVRNSSGAR